MIKENKIQSQKDLQKIQKESLEQVLPKQRKVLSASDKIRRKTSNLPDPVHPPMGWKDGKGYDHIYPWIYLPRMHPLNHGDTVIFNVPDLPANQFILGDNLEVLRTLPSECVDLIYIDPPFFSGRTYNVIWGDTNEVRTFYDIWEGGIDSYLVWLNARLWEMRRVLKKTGSIYVHCDWHASHYIKIEMDKIFGYESFISEIVWKRSVSHGNSLNYGNVHDTLLFYGKTKDYFFETQFMPYEDDYIAKYYRYVDKNGRKFLSDNLAAPGAGGYEYEWHGHLKKWRLPKKRMIELDKQGKIFYTKNGVARFKRYLDEMPGQAVHTLWADKEVQGINSWHKEYIGYPTQKPEGLLKRVINSSCPGNGIVADFFCGGGTTLAVAQQLKRKFIGCDSSRVAISVSLDRLVKVGEEMSGVKSNISVKKTKVSLKKDLFSKEAFQYKLQAEHLTEKVPNIEVSYLGVYPIEKFENYPQDTFVDFVLTCYGASRNTAEGITDGYRPPGQSEPILVSPSNPRESISGEIIKKFFDEIKSKLEPNKLVQAKIVGWRFNRQVVKYIKILEEYIEKNNLPLTLELIPLDFKEFRSRILQRYPDITDAEFFLRFSKAPVIGDIKIKKVKDLEYEFEAIDTFSTNEDGWLVNCQWDFEYQEGHFTADKDYILSREKVKNKKRGEIFKAILKAKHKFEKSGGWTIACKVQDNLAGETIINKKIKI